MPEVVPGQHLLDDGDLTPHPAHLHRAKVLPTRSYLAVQIVGPLPDLAHGVRLAEAHEPAGHEEAFIPAPHDEGPDDARGRGEGVGGLAVRGYGGRVEQTLHYPVMSVNYYRHNQLDNVCPLSLEG